MFEAGKEASMTGDTLMAILCTGVVGLIVLVSEAAGRFFGAPARVTRLMVHVSAGIIVSLAPLLFEGRWWPVGVAASVLLTMIITLRKGWLPAIHAARPSSLGTVWFAAAALLFFLLAWNEPFLITIPLLTMTFADAAGAVIGEFRQSTSLLPPAFGKKTWDGSIGVFLFAWFTVGLGWETFGLGPAGQALLVGLACAPVVTAAEALCRKGIDNLAVPLATVVTLLVIDSAPGQPQALLLAEAAGMLLAAASLKWRALSPDGAAGAFLIVAWLFGGGGFTWTLPILVFFIISSILSQVYARTRPGIEGIVAKGHERDIAQVAANGSVALAAYLGVVAGLPVPLMWAAMLGAVATATADTWATEIGMGHRRNARLITTGRVVPAGTSGGVTLIGSAGSLLGAVVIGMTALALAPVEQGSVLTAAVAGAIGGVAGSLADSVLGAAIQVRSRCPSCGLETEQRTHCDDVPTVTVSGWRFVDNDVVNALSGLVGAGAALLLFLTLR
jgi:uncharacterized protein (TIGR00297 family)